MEQEIYMLPVRCKGCDAVFDLWSVLQEQESKGVVSEEHELEKFMRQSLCYQCQQAVRMGLEDDVAEDVEEEDNSESQEYEMLLDFE
ncbi:MAG: hypothetical protein ABIH92_02260 [Nanoarchaeota archaeon]